MAQLVLILLFSTHRPPARHAKCMCLASPFIATQRAFWSILNYLPSLSLGHLDNVVLFNNPSYTGTSLSLHTLFALPFDAGYFQVVFWVTPLVWFHAQMIDARNIKQIIMYLISKFKNIFYAYLVRIVF